MKILVQVLIFIAFLPLNGEPLHILLKNYADSYFHVSAVSDSIADSVETKYGETFYALDESGTVVHVLDRDEVKDTLINEDSILIRKNGFRVDETIQKYDFEDFSSLKNEIKRMIEASIPNANYFSKSIDVKFNFLNSRMFNARIDTFTDFFRILIEMAFVIQKEDSSFMRQDTFPEKYYDFLPYSKWHDVMLDIEELEIEESLRKYEIKYGPKSSKINLIELILIESFSCLKGDENGPSHWEPIVRFTPICYDATDSRFFKTFQLGVNYYFFKKGFLEWLNHIGIALLIADAENEVIYKWNSISIGVQLHLGKYQLGILRDRTKKEWKITSTVDLQIIPMLF